MRMKLNYRIVIFALAIVFGIAFSVPSLFQTKDGKKVTLGLDLQGGLHMLLGVKTNEAVKSRIKSIAASVKHFTDKKEILIDGLTFNSSSVSFSLLDTDDTNAVNDYLSKIKGAIVLIKGAKVSVHFSQKEIKVIKQHAVSQAIETIRNRLDQFGLTEPLVAKQGKDKILVELAGIKSAADEQRARKLISRAAKLELMAVDEDRNGRVYSMSNSDAAEYGDVILSDVKNPKIKYLVHEIPILDGGMLTDAN